MKSISELSKQEGRVYVYFSSKEICNQFFADAELEGFIFADVLNIIFRCSNVQMCCNRRI